MDSIGRLPTHLAKSPALAKNWLNLNSMAERFVRTIEKSCLDWIVLIGEDVRRTKPRFACRRCGRWRPEEFIATLACWAYALPPAFDLEPSVSVAPCLHTGYYPVHAEMRENDLKLYREWRAKTSAPLFLWVYYHERGIEDWQERSHACRK